MSDEAFLTVVTAEETVTTRSGAADVSRVTRQLSVDTLRGKFVEFMNSLDAAFDSDELRTQTGMFQLEQIQFSVELSASGDFKLLGTGVGVGAGAALSFVLTRKV